MHIFTMFSTFAYSEVRSFMQMVRSYNIQYVLITDPRKIRSGAFGKAGVYTSKPDTPPGEYMNVYDPMAATCALYDKYQLTAVSDYLFMNGANVLQPVST